MQWFSNLVSKKTDHDPNAWMQVMSFIVGSVIALACVWLVFIEIIKGDNAMYLLLGLVIIFMSAAGLVTLSDRTRDTLTKMAEEKTKRVPAPPVPVPVPVPDQTTTTATTANAPAKTPPPAPSGANSGE